MKNNSKLIILLVMAVLLSFTACTTRETAAAQETITETPVPTPEATPAPTPEPTPALIELLGEKYAFETESINLSSMTSEQVAEVCSVLPEFTDLKYIDLMPEGYAAPVKDTEADSEVEETATPDAQEEEETEEEENAPASLLTVKDVKAIMEAVPDAEINYYFDFYGQLLSVQDERVEYDGVEVESADEVRDVLDILKKCTYFKLADSGIDYDTMAQIREEYADRTKVVWRVYFGIYTHTLTDETSIRAIFDLDDTNSYNLRYCNEVKYMDIGHNDHMRDISFCAYMPDLEILILSGSEVSDLSPLAGLDKLVWLETTFCGYIDDLSPLKDCSSLAYVNISYGKSTDLSVFDDKPLERFVFFGSSIPWDERVAFSDAHPDCWVSFTGENPYIKGWRYDDDKGTIRCAMYQKVRDVFDYENNFYNKS